MTKLDQKLARESREAQRLLDAAQNEEDPARAARLVREAKRLGR